MVEHLQQRHMVTDLVWGFWLVEVDVMGKGKGECGCGCGDAWDARDCGGDGWF